MDLDDLKGLTGPVLSFPDPMLTKPERRPSLRKPRRSEPALLRVRVDLEHAKPPIWRRLDVRSDIGLDVFHQVLQSAFGWTDTHLHRFALGGSPFDRNTELFLCPYDVEEGEDDGVPAKDVTLDETLSEPGDVLQYCYDYGDSWDLIIALESVSRLDEPAPVAACVDGRRAAPPEDCGGMRNAADLAEVLEDPAGFDLDEINQALNDPYLRLHGSRLDPRLAELLNRLRYTPTGDDLVSRLMSLTQHRSEVSPAEKAAALRPLLRFLDHVGVAGLQLTSAGYLKPDDVRALAAVIPAMAPPTASRRLTRFCGSVSRPRSWPWYAGTAAGSCSRRQVRPYAATPTRSGGISLAACPSAKPAPSTNPLASSVSPSRHRLRLTIFRWNTSHRP
jgi:Plasmid pRiA4b ORF-3-like protein